MSSPSSASGRPGLGRLLATPAVEPEVRLLGAADPLPDPVVEARLAQAVAEARAAGRREAAAEAAAAADEAAARVVGALARADADLRALAASADVALALRIARAVLGREPHDDTAVLLQRVEQALAGLDDDHLTVHLHPADAALLHDPVQRLATGLGVALDVVEDATIPAGEALLAGRWARADLTRASAWQAVQAALGEGRDA